MRAPRLPQSPAAETIAPDRAPTASRDAEHIRWFAEEVQPHEPTLRAYLRRQFPHLKDLDDVVQESFLKTLRAKLQGELRSARGFLFVAARNLALDDFRRRRTLPLGENERAPEWLVPDSAPSAAEAASRGQELDLLLEAIEALPTRCRQVLKLRKISELSHREIASQLGIAERTVNVQVGLGLRRCAAYVRARSRDTNKPR